MSVKDVLESLGSQRTIWIDDFFNDGPDRLARILLHEIDVTETCDIPELDTLLRRARRTPDAATPDVVAALAAAGEERMLRIKDAFFRARRAMGRSGPEMSSAQVDHVCNLLDVRKEDRWPFDEAFTKLPDICANGGQGDAHINYVVDLNDTMTSTTRGLDVLIALAGEKSKGTAFILTHDAETAQEASTELNLRRQMERQDPEMGRLQIPVCVVAKERLFGDPAATDIEDALSVALKRAGLQRSIHEVLWKAEGTLGEAFEEAASRLVEIPPEQLETHVVDRGYREGVSELHVVERALTAHMAKTLREMFGVDLDVRRSAKRMRSLRKVKLKDQPPGADENLAAFYEAEVWEEGTLLNKSYSPIACGDVFELDSDEPEVKKTVRRYVLLGQPCDISLRPEQKRQQDTAFLVAMKVKTTTTDKQSDKEPVLPFQIDQKRWELQFRTATVAKLAILDLASFREDGRVRVDLGHAVPNDLLDGLASVYGARTNASDHALAAAAAEKEAAEAKLKAAQEAKAEEARVRAVARAEAAASAAASGQSGREVGEAAVAPEAAAGDAAATALPAPAVESSRPAAAGKAIAKDAPKEKAEKKSASVLAPKRTLIDPDLQLTFSSADDFKLVHRGVSLPAQVGTKGNGLTTLPARVTWRLRRCGRIRMPFAAALLEQYTAGVSRRAFDLDYVSTNKKPADTRAVPEPVDAEADEESVLSVDRRAAASLRRDGFSQDQIESWFGYVPEPLEDAGPAPEAAQDVDLELQQGAEQSTGS